MFSQSLFNDPFQNGYNYGYAYASHFGKTAGTGDVECIEVGNEPWMGGVGYASPSFYQSVLAGMAKGVKDADPSMRVLPAVFGSLADTLARMNASQVAYLDALNAHAYSWIQTPVGQVGVHPEHNMSTIHTVNSLIRFRDAVLPGLPVYLTEWGWDSAGGGEGCNPPVGISSGANFTQCVSELAQAVYAVRGLLVLARKGLSRLTWYFYGNTAQSVSSWQQSGGIFSRSGLTSSQAAGYRSKLALTAFNQFIASYGNISFLGTLREDSEGYAYVLGDAGKSVATHVVVWLPVSVVGNSVVALSSHSTSITFASNLVPTGIHCLPAFCSNLQSAY